MRGKVAGNLEQGRVVGITPACAGKRHTALLSTGQNEDHPRVCGEKRPSRWKICRQLGSPPRMRGKVVHRPGRRLRLGITPAYAGKRCSARTPTFRTWDHPRVCGEKLVEAGRISQEEGSPPRVRGKDFRCLGKRTRSRIAPAYAGKSKTSAVGCPGCRDHPRVCGEKCPPGKFFFMTVGSPPPVQGKVPSSI